MKLVALAALLCSSAAELSQDTYSFEITVTAPKHDVNGPLHVPVALPAAFAEARVGQLDVARDWSFPVQVTRPGLNAPQLKLADGQVQREIHFNKGINAGELKAWKVTIAKGNPGLAKKDFHWTDTPGEHAELSEGDRPVLRYMYKGLDESSKQAREQTFKVYHHLYDPAGKQLLTKGPGGLYTHHRGIFYGFNKVTYGTGKSCDIWHCPVAYQSHEKFESIEEGELLGRHTVVIAWHGLDKEIFARERRELTVYKGSTGHLVEFASELTPLIAPVKLDGDPQHAGFHFRAANEVNAKQTYFLRPSGKGEEGKEWNWPAQKEQANLPWDAMSFTLSDKRYTCAYLDRPQNPKEARFSERTYGRFGSYFVHTLEEGKPLRVNYRLWLDTDEMKAADVAAKSADFVDPPQVTVK